MWHGYTWNLTAIHVYMAVAIGWLIDAWCFAWKTCFQLSNRCLRFQVYIWYSGSRDPFGVFERLVIWRVESPFGAKGCKISWAQKATSLTGRSGSTPFRHSPDLRATSFDWYEFYKLLWRSKPQNASGKIKEGEVCIWMIFNLPARRTVHLMMMQARTR